MSSIYHTIFFDPLYNILILLFKFLPWADAGIVVIILTVLVRLVLFPLSRKAVVTQVKMNSVAPHLEDIKQKYKDAPEQQARKTLEFYREKGINPFSGILMILIQIPLVIALYQIFFHLPQTNSDLLYSFVSAPEHIKTTFIGLIDIGQKSFIIALLAGLSTFLQFYVSSRNQLIPKGNSFGDNLTRSMQTQMKYFFPVIVFFISYRISGVIALYWLTTNLFSAAQEFLIRRKLSATA